MNPFLSTQRHYGPVSSNPSGLFGPDRTIVSRRHSGTSAAMELPNSFLECEAAESEPGAVESLDDIVNTYSKRLHDVRGFPLLSHDVCSSVTNGIDIPFDAKLQMLDDQPLSPVFPLDAQSHYSTQPRDATEYTARHLSLRERISLLPAASLSELNAEDTVAPQTANLPSSTQQWEQYKRNPLASRPQPCSTDWQIRGSDSQSATGPPPESTPHPYPYSHAGPVFDFLSANGQNPHQRNGLPAQLHNQGEVLPSMSGPSKYISSNQLLTQPPINIPAILKAVSVRPNPRFDVGILDMSCAFCVSDYSSPDQPILYASDTLCWMTGYDPQELRGRNCRLLQDPSGGIKFDSKTKSVTLQRETLTRSSDSTLDSTSRAVKYYATAVDPEATESMKRAILEEKESQTFIINYRKGGIPFVNMVTIIPITYNNVKYLVGFQLDVVQGPEALYRAVQRPNKELSPVDYRQPSFGESSKRQFSSPGPPWPLCHDVHVDTDTTASLLEPLILPITASPGPSVDTMHPIPSNIRSGTRPVLAQLPASSCSMVEPSLKSGGMQLSDFSTPPPPQQQPRLTAATTLSSFSPSATLRTYDAGTVAVQSRPPIGKSASEVSCVGPAAGFPKQAVVPDRMLSLLNLSTDVIMIMTIGGVIQYLSPNACRRVLQFDSRDLLSQHINTICHPCDITSVSRELKILDNLTKVQGPSSKGGSTIASPHHRARMPRPTAAPQPSGHCLQSKLASGPGGLALPQYAGNNSNSTSAFASGTSKLSASDMTNEVGGSNTSTGSPKNHSICMVFRIRRKHDGWMWMECRGSFLSCHGKPNRWVLLVGRERCLDRVLSVSLPLRDAPLPDPPSSQAAISGLKSGDGLGPAGLGGKAGNSLGIGGVDAVTDSSISACDFQEPFGAYQFDASQPGVTRQIPPVDNARAKDPAELPLGFLMKVSVSGIILYASSNVRKVLQVESSALVGTGIQALMTQRHHEAEADKWTGSTAGDETADNDVQQQRTQVQQCITAAASSGVVSECIHSVYSGSGQCISVETTIFPGRDRGKRRSTFLLLWSRVVAPGQMKTRMQAESQRVDDEGVGRHFGTRGGDDDDNNNMAHPGTKRKRTQIKNEEAKDDDSDDENDDDYDHDHNNKNHNDRECKNRRQKRIRLGWDNGKNTGLCDGGEIQWLHADERGHNSVPLSIDKATSSSSSSVLHVSPERSSLFGPGKQKKKKRAASMEKLYGTRDTNDDDDDDDEFPGDKASAEMEIIHPALCKSWIKELQLLKQENEQLRLGLRLHEEQVVQRHVSPQPHGGQFGVRSNYTGSGTSSNVAAAVPVSISSSLPLASSALQDSLTGGSAAAVGSGVVGIAPNGPPAMTVRPPVMHTSFAQVAANPAAMCSDAAVTTGCIANNGLIAEPQPQLQPQDMQLAQHLSYRAGGVHGRPDFGKRVQKSFETSFGSQQRQNQYQYPKQQQYHRPLHFQMPVQAMDSLQSTATAAPMPTCFSPPRDMQHQKLPRNTYTSPSSVVDKYVSAPPNGLLLPPSAGVGYPSNTCTSTSSVGINTAATPASTIDFAAPYPYQSDLLQHVNAATCVACKLVYPDTLEAAAAAAGGWQSAVDEERGL